ncbi:unnamed protein product, partial [Adineta steineri]
MDLKITFLIGQIDYSSNTLQETLDYIIQKQENEIHRLHDELQREIYRCFERIHDLEL